MISNAAPRTEAADHRDLTRFPGLNGLRFFAALLVVMHHVETIRQSEGLSNLRWLGLFRNGGPAVIFFFVLSGFLITYILMRENRRTGSVHIGRFYLKRVLRIWPLYFLLVAIGLFGLPLAFKLLHIPYQAPYTAEKVWHYFVFFVPGIVTFLHGHHFLDPLWSIGVEEVYYLGWAPLFRLLRRHLLRLLIAVVAIKTVLAILVWQDIGGALFAYLVTSFRFEAMAIGGLGAYLVFNHGQALQSAPVFHRSVQLFILGALLLYLVFHDTCVYPLWVIVFKTPVFSELLVQVLFLYLILVVSVVRKGVLRLDSPWLDHLGDISYGIYMYHMLVLFTCMFLIERLLEGMPSVVGHVLLHLIVVGGTIAMASLSKRFFENPFLRYKQRLDGTPRPGSISPTPAVALEPRTRTT